ncbi:hypothetical protein D3C85_1404640 [compost metagenome]
MMNLFKQRFSSLNVFFKELGRRQVVINVVLEHQANECRDLSAYKAVPRKEMLHIRSLHLAGIPNHVVSKAEVGNCVHVARRRTETFQLNEDRLFLPHQSPLLRYSPQASPRLGHFRHQRLKIPEPFWQPLLLE